MSAEAKVETKTPGVGLFADCRMAVREQKSRKLRVLMVLLLVLVVLATTARMVVAAGARVLWEALLAYVAVAWLLLRLLVGR